ncbi:unnamed protein product, partial [Ilex paraguariensis]
LEILAFPCNQFGSQEPGSNEEIQQFACTRFRLNIPYLIRRPSKAFSFVTTDLVLLDFVLWVQIDVNGSNAAPLYKFLKSSKGGIFGDGIKWNFSKFLVDKEGNVVDRYAPTTSPLGVEKDIKKLLGIA